jgi:hypothetical protein
MRALEQLLHTIARGFGKSLKIQKNLARGKIKLSGHIRPQKSYVIKNAQIGLKILRYLTNT